MSSIAVETIHGTTTFPSSFFPNTISPCHICFRHDALPSLQINTCKHYFHHACLYKRIQKTTERQFVEWRCPDCKELTPIHKKGWIGRGKQMAQQIESGVQVAFNTGWNVVQSLSKHTDAQLRELPGYSVKEIMDGTHYNVTDPTQTKSLRKEVWSKYEWMLEPDHDERGESEGE